MLKQFLTRSFYQCLLVSDGALVVLILLYNLLAMVIPVTKLTWSGAILTFILINVLLIGLKIAIPLLNQRSQP